MFVEDGAIVLILRIKLWHNCHVIPLILLEEATSGCHYTVDLRTDLAWLRQLPPWLPAELLPGHEGSSMLPWPIPPELWTCWPHSHGKNYGSADEVLTSYCG